MQGTRAVRRELVRTQELIEVIAAELIQGLVQPHVERLPGPGFLRDGEEGLFGSARLFLFATLALAGTGRLRQALPCGARGSGQERDGRTGLPVERAGGELGR